MALGSHVCHCPNCDLVAPVSDLSPCCQCGKDHCRDCRQDTDDRDSYACSAVCVDQFNARTKEERVQPRMQRITVTLQEDGLPIVRIQ